MAILNLALVCDGTSDLCLGDFIIWLMDTHFPEAAFRVVPANEVIPAKGPLSLRLQRAVDLYKPDVIFCHRDSERASLLDRINEIENAAGDLEVPAVAIVPVRMLEAWLLFDVNAVRTAAENKNGTAPITLPALAAVESIANPKQVLFDALQNATGLSVRRRRVFNEKRARSLVSGYIDDFSPLRRLSSFQRFEDRFRHVLNVILNPQ